MSANRESGDANLFRVLFALIFAAFSSIGKLAKNLKLHIRKIQLEGSDSDLQGARLGKCNALHGWEEKTNQRMESNFIHWVALSEQQIVWKVNKQAWGIARVSFSEVG